MGVGGILTKEAEPTVKKIAGLIIFLAAGGAFILDYYIKKL